MKEKLREVMKRASQLTFVAVFPAPGIDPSNQTKIELPKELGLEMVGETAARAFSLRDVKEFIHLRWMLQLDIDKDPKVQNTGTKPVEVRIEPDFESVLEGRGGY